MKQGQSNSVWEVLKLQLFLVAQGLVTDFDGVFGDNTAAGVRLFQSMHTSEVLQPWVDAGAATDLTPSGYVYKTTQWKINDMVCPGVATFPQLP
jgi:peptidoglycan hydrolase-like protein with peptidoglycan-binding domain